MSKSKWKNISSKGYKKFMIFEGVKVGLFSGSVGLIIKFLSLKYLIEKEINIGEFVVENLVWYPLAILFGFYVAHVIWKGRGKNTVPK